MKCFAVAFAIFLSACSVNVNPPVDFAPTVTLSATQTFTPSSVPFVSTLPADEALEKLLSLLANNGGCHLPCLWGITPGQSTYVEAQDIFTSLSSLSTFTGFAPKVGTIFPNYTHGDLSLVTNADFSVDSLSKDQTINKVGFQARELKRVGNAAIEVFDSTFFKEHLDYYMLPNVLTEYGRPEMIMLATMAKLPSSGLPGGFKILLLYPDQGILINYTMQMQIAGENIRGCPSNSNIELDLYPSGQSTLFLDRLEPSGWTQIIKTYKSIEDTTLMTKEDFYQVFRQQTDQCVLTPANFWPVPD